jgi:type I restriction enzyme, S subunit
VRDAISTKTTALWHWKPLGELCNIKYGKLLATTQLSASGYPVFGANGVIGYHTSYLYRDEEVLISCRGAYSGKVNLSPSEAYITNNSLVLEFRNPSEVCKRFYYYALQVADKSTLVTGTAQPQVTINNAINVKVPVVPLDLQRQIVAEIEKQFTRLDAGVAGLRRVQANLKRYRAAVLKAACEGTLVPTEAELARQEGRTYETGAQLLERILTERHKNWRGRGQYKFPTAADGAKLGILPEGWVWAVLDALADIKGGITKDQGRKHSAPVRSVPYLRVANVQRGYIDLTEVKEIVTTEDEIQQLALKPGDVLFNEGGDRDKLGRGWIWNGELPECIHQNHVFRARLYVAELSPKLVSWYANTFGQRFFFDEGKHTTNLASISMSKLKGLPVPIPPLAEQTRIVAEVERRLSVVEELEGAVNANLQRATRLRQSILQRAFEGNLLTNWSRRSTAEESSSGRILG